MLIAISLAILVSLAFFTPLAEYHPLGAHPCLINVAQKNTTTVWSTSVNWTNSKEGVHQSAACEGVPFRCYVCYRKTFKTFVSTL